MSVDEKTLQLPPMVDPGTEPSGVATSALPDAIAPHPQQRGGGRICPLCRVRSEAARCAVDGFLTVDERAQNPAPALEGTVLGGAFMLEKRLSESAHCQVYSGTQLSIERPVAVKVRRHCDARHLRGIARFQREARVLGELDHPRIVRLIDLGVTATGTFYMALEHLQGEPLAALVSRTRLAPPHIIAIAANIADALSAVHAAGLVHRNVSPANVIVLRGLGEVGAVKLVDFRLVKELDPAPEVAEAPAVTRTGELVGDPRYLAPEQIINATATPATDVYCLGLVIYEMLTGGQHPFEESSSIDLAVSHVTASPAPPTLDGRVLAGALVDLVRSFIARSPSHRPQNGAAALAALREVEALKPQKQLYFR